MCPRLGKLVDARRLRLVELLAPLLHLLALVGLQEGDQVLHVAWLLEDQVGQDGLDDALPAHPESSSCLALLPCEQQGGLLLHLLPWVSIRKADPLGLWLLTGAGAEVVETQPLEPGLQHGGLLLHLLDRPLLPVPPGQLDMELLHDATAAGPVNHLVGLSVLPGGGAPVSVSCPLSKLPHEEALHFRGHEARGSERQLSTLQTPS